jgi:hypothetical protein
MTSHKHSQNYNAFIYLHGANTAFLLQVFTQPISNYNENYHHKDTHGTYETHYAVDITKLTATTPAF